MEGSQIWESALISDTPDDASIELKKPVRAWRPRDKAPLLKISVSLLNTYLGINEKYYQSKEQAKKETNKRQSCDDQNFDYIINIGEVWEGRYKVLKVLGRGSFGQVVEAYDAQTRDNVAIKIIKNKRAFHVQAVLEIRIVQFLNTHDKKDAHNIVRMKRNFEWKSHLCIVYELLSINLYELLRNQSFHGVTLNLVRKFAHQILTALRFLSSPEVQVIHCDLKPENILLVNPKRSALKVVDFGSSCFRNQKTYLYIQSRFYRSPEILLGIPYSMPIDMWSLGCLLVEMHVGSPLFDGLNEHEQVCKIVDVLGMPATKVIDQGSRKKISQMFCPLGAGYKLNLSKGFVSNPRTLEEIVYTKVGGSPKGLDTPMELEYTQFLDFLRQVLTYDPSTRMTPEEALQHPWFQSMKPKSASRTTTTSGTTIKKRGLEKLAGFGSNWLGQKLKR